MRGYIINPPQKRNAAMPTASTRNTNAPKNIFLNREEWEGLGAITSSVGERVSCQGIRSLYVFIMQKTSRHSRRRLNIGVQFSICLVQEAFIITDHNFFYYTIICVADSDSLIIPTNLFFSCTHCFKTSASAISGNISPCQYPNFSRSLIAPNNSNPKK